MLLRPYLPLDVAAQVTPLSCTLPVGSFPAQRSISSSQNATRLVFRRSAEMTARHEGSRHHQLPLLGQLSSSFAAASGDVLTELYAEKGEMVQKLDTWEP